ncbi:DUF2871 family protein [Streptomyces sp. NBC_00385]|uniref:DUF2871 family protein n=1 Tax=Streptomyces sp. NBC_00385 TaxID=2975733 RepID=UPI002DDA5918|nr:DUF2871 family protein [Streptomyces sp. NBC_00385]WRZ03028.1 DUF2871 domain-containing protein [Streptomyces sp. NBC_00385]
MVTWPASAWSAFTKAQDFTGETQLALIHTHLLTLGMLGFLIILALDKQVRLSGTRLFTTVAMMGLHGCLTVLNEHVPDTVPALAGAGHILLTVGLILLFVTLGKRLKEPDRTEFPTGTPS